MKKLFYALVLVLMVGALAACSNDNAEPENNDTETSGPKEGGSISIGVTGEPSAFNPLYSADQSSLIIQQAFLSPLFYVVDGEVQPALAESLTPSEDNLTYTLKLKEGLTWHDGEPLTAEDIVFTIDSILDENQATWLRGSFVFDGKPVEVSAVDETTVEIKLPIVTPAFEAAVHVLYPIPKHIYEGEADLSKSEKNNNPVGSGPFKFVEYKTGQYVKFERFDDFFDGKPYLDEMIFRILKDENAGNLALQNGEIHMKMLQATDVEKIDKTGKVDIVTYPEYRLTFLAFNQLVPEFADLKFRQALSHALNREDMIIAAYGSEEFASPASSILTPDVLYQTSDVETYPYDMEKAKQLLAESDFDTSKTIKVLYVNNNKAQEGMALYMQQQFKELGVNLQLDAKDPAATYAISGDRESTDYDLYIDAYVMRAEPDPYKQLYVSDAIYNYPNYKDEEYDALWAKAAVTPNGEEREALYNEIQEFTANEALVYPISYDNNTFALDKQYGGVDEATPQQITLLRDYSKLYKK